MDPAFHTPLPPEIPGAALTDLAGVPQVEEADEALVAHLLIRGKHDDVASKVEAARPHGRAGLHQGQLLPWEEQRELRDRWERGGKMGGRECLGAAGDPRNH